MNARQLGVSVAAAGLSLLLATCGGGGGGDNAAAAPVCTPTAPGAAPAVNDPLFSDQWHLRNTGQAGGCSGQDVNMSSVWNAGTMGAGVRIAVVDDGLEILHEDLAPNVVPGQSHNYVVANGDPTGGEHGTAVGGVAAARDSNGLGGAGAAPQAGLVGYNLLQSLTAGNEADAMTRNGVNVFVSNNSWGAPDNGLWAESALTWRNAIDMGLANGRNGLGTIYTWAAGNGGAAQGPSNAGVDNSNYDGQANYRGVLAICAVGDDGVKAFYSERGANLWVCTPSMGRANHAITTTDRTGALGYNAGAAPDYPDARYTNTFNGTSSAAPLAAGVIALILQANSALTWRDLRIVLAQSARKNHPADSDWTVNGAGFNINHNYGFGVANAAAAVALASTWVNVGAAVTFGPVTASPNLSIPDNNATGVSNTINVAGSGIGRIEFVAITFNTNHTYVGDLDITLTAPSGTVSRLSEQHLCAGGCGGAPGGTWRFGSARHLGEAANGNWTLAVKDLFDADVGTFQSWQITFYGRLN